MAKYCYTAVGNKNVTRLCVTKEDISCQKNPESKSDSEMNLI